MKTFAISAAAAIALAGATLGAATALLGPAAHVESAHAASPAHSGHAFVPPQLPTPGELELFAQEAAPMILQLTPAAPWAAETVLRAAGAEPIGPQLRIWRLRGPGSAKAIARVQSLHDVTRVIDEHDTVVH